MILYNALLNLCKTLFDTVCLYIALYDSECLCRNQFHSQLFFFTLLDSVWLYLTLFDSIWFCLALFDSVFLGLILFNHVWPGVSVSVFEFLICLIPLVQFYSTLFKLAWYAKLCLNQFNSRSYAQINILNVCGFALLCCIWYFGSLKRFGEIKWCSSRHQIGGF